MKPILKILAAAISSFFLAPLLFAERVLFDVDEWGVPEIRTEGRVFSEGERGFVPAFYLREDRGLGTANEKTCRER